MLIDLNSLNFQKEITNNEKYVLVDFWAPWCEPCRHLAPVFQDIANDYAESVDFAKVNVDTENKIPAEFNVRGLPTLILFKDGKPVSNLVGAQSKAKIVCWLQKNIKTELKQEMVA